MQPSQLAQAKDIIEKAYSGIGGDAGDIIVGPKDEQYPVTRKDDARTVLVPREHVDDQEHLIIETFLEPLL